MYDPDFPNAAELELPARYARDIDSLARTLKFSNPHELLAHWEWLVRRLVRAEATFAPEALNDRLLGGMYAFYRDELEASAGRVERARRDPRLGEKEVARLEQAHAALEAYRDQIVRALPALRRLLIDAAAAIMAEGSEAASEP